MTLVAPTILFFDTETTGLPYDSNVDALVCDGNWPDIVSISWIVNKGRVRVRKETYLIRPEGWTISPESTAIHGISQERAEAEGESLAVVMERFWNAVEGADWVIAHNMYFDRNVVFHATQWRLDMDPLQRWPLTGELCSMEKARPEMKLPFRNGRNYRSFYKAPRLTELYENQFHRGFQGAHTADGDVEALHEIVSARWAGLFCDVVAEEVAQERQRIRDKKKAEEEKRAQRVGTLPDVYHW